MKKIFKIFWVIFFWFPLEICTHYCIDVVGHLTVFLTNCNKQLNCCSVFCRIILRFLNLKLNRKRKLI